MRVPAESTRPELSETNAEGLAPAGSALAARQRPEGTTWEPSAQAAVPRPFRCPKEAGCTGLPRERVPHPGKGSRRGSGGQKLPEPLL